MKTLQSPFKTMVIAMSYYASMVGYIQIPVTKYCLRVNCSNSLNSTLATLPHNS